MKDTSVKLDAWLRRSLKTQGACATPSLLSDLRRTMRTAGFTERVEQKDERLATRVLKKALGAEKEPLTRVAAFVEAGGVCPRCGGPMKDARLADGEGIQVCSNMRCRMSAYIEE